MKRIIIFFLPILLFLVIWGSSLIRCEVLTLKYQTTFNEVLNPKTIFGDIEYCKIIDYSKNQARIYYVTEGHSSGHILFFIKENQSWTYVKWETIWSNAGNADNVIWPYWWHTFYSHAKLAT